MKNLKMTPRLPASFIYTLKEKEELIIDKEPLVQGETINQELTELITPIIKTDNDEKVRAYLQEKLKT